MNVYGDFIRNCTKLETTQLSLNRWTDTLQRITSKDYYYQYSSTQQHYESQIRPVWYQSQTQKAAYNTILSIFWKRRNCRNRKQIGGCEELGVREGVHFYKEA